MENKKPLVSVIVPVYNVEKFLERCVESILQQSYKNLEIILVDDGSNDSSGLLCDQIKQKDNRIVVIHKQNGGLSSARNAGLDVCKGDFISFIDSDDWIETEMYESMVEASLKNNTHISFCGRYDVSEKTYERKVGLCHKNNEVISWIECLKRCLKWDNADFSAVDKIYSASLWKNVRFPAGKICEDIGTLYKVIAEASTVSLINKPFYNYFHRASSITTNKKFSPSVFDFESHAIDIRTFINNKCPELNTYADIFYLTAINYSIWKILENKKTTKSFKKRLNSYRKIIRSFKNNIDISSFRRMPNQMTSILNDFCNHLISIKHLYRKIRTNIGQLVYYKRNLKLKYLKKSFKKTSKNKRLVLLSTPSYGNVGDHAILLGEKRIVEEAGVKNEVEVNSIDYGKFSREIKQMINPNDLIILDGGGNFGDTWPSTLMRFLEIIETFTNKIIVFPESWYFSNSIFGKDLLRITTKVLNDNSNHVTMFARDKWSFNEIKKHCPNLDLRYSFDVALCAGDFIHNKDGNKHSICFSVRNDKEKVDFLDEVFSKVNNFDVTTVDNDTYRIVNESERKDYLNKILSNYQNSSIVVTERFHGIIFSILSGCKCIAIDNKTNKIAHFIDDIKDFNNGSFVVCKSTEVEEEFLKIVNLEFDNDKIKKQALLFKNELVTCVKENYEN